MPLESPQSDILPKSYGQNTETCSESKFESNPIFGLQLMNSELIISTSSRSSQFALKLGNFLEMLHFLPCPKKTQKTQKGNKMEQNNKN
jgi:hypothetical protein